MTRGPMPAPARPRRRGTRGRPPATLAAKSNRALVLSASGDDYSTALYYIAKASDFGLQRELAIWRRQCDCWEHIVDLSPLPGERLSIPPAMRVA